MVFQSQLTTVFRCFNITRYVSQWICSSRSVLQFSSLHIAVNHLNDEPSEKHIKNESNIEEKNLLDELSNLLPIRHKASNQSFYKESSSDNQFKMRAVDGFLPPEEKLRGVFIQKLKGKNAIERALTNAGVELSTDVVGKVVNRGNLGGEAMVLFFNWAIEQPAIPKEVDSYHIILKALGRRKYFADMVEILHDMRMKGISPNSETLFIVMDSFVRARQVSKAIKMFGQLEEFGWKCDTDSFNVLIRCLNQRSHVGAASSLLNKMREKLPFDSTTYNLVIGGWSKCGGITKIERTLKAMVADGFHPDNLTFSYLLEGLGRAGQIDDAVEIFENLENKEGCAPNTAVYNAMISNFISVGDFDECSKYYKRMLSNSCDPDTDTYFRIISAFLKARKVADAIEMFDEMLGRGIIPTRGTITSFIESLCSYGPPHAALMIYKKARKIGCIISLSTYKLLLMRLSKCGKCGMLLNIWDEMQENGYAPDMEVYEHVIHGLCNVGQLENAVLVMEESLRKGFFPSKLICSELNDKLLNSNKVEMAYKLFLKIKVTRCNENSWRHWRAK